VASASGKLVDLTQQWAIVEGSTSSHSSQTISDASLSVANDPFLKSRISAGSARTRDRRQFSGAESGGAG